MKKITVLIVFLLSLSNTHSNPVMVPQAFISEFAFESDTHWTLEIMFRFGDEYNHSDFDSICVATSHGSSRIRLDHIQDSTSLFVITSDSLMSPLSINSEGDQIIVYSYPPEYDGMALVDYISFGNVPGSSIDVLPPGYSICRLKYYLFCKDKSPTIGFANDTAGTCGTLKGYLLDKNDAIVTGGNFEIDNPFVFSDDSTYSTRIFSRKFNISAITKFISLESLTSLRIDSLFIDMDPDSLLEENIHCKDYIVGILKNTINQSLPLEIMNYPNPFNSSTTFSVRIPADVHYRTAFIHIYSIDGKRIYTLPVSEHSLMQWNGQTTNGEPAATGVYYYQLLLNNIVYKSGSMILLK